MSERFEHGYAVIIGVDQNNLPNLVLPTVAKDVQALYNVLVHPQRCAYKPAHVKLLQGPDATSGNILEALYWLQTQVASDPDATAVLYYSGHGWVDTTTGQYYLIPYNIRSRQRLRADGIRAEVLAAEISSIQAQRTLIILDCCHAAGMDVKAVAQDTVQPAPFPLDLPETQHIPSLTLAPGAKGVSDLLDGQGRAVLNSSTGAQLSYIRTDGQMSLFTYHLIEALTGHARPADDATVVYVTDVMSWVTHRVKQSAQEQNRNQTPVMRTDGVFPVAMLIGGQGTKGVGGTPPDPLAPLPTTSPAFHQERQTVEGTQVNVGGNATIDQIGDRIHTDGGDVVQGNKRVQQGDTVYGDKVGGDKVSGDKISVGNISGSSGIAIGRGARATVTQGMGSAELTQLFAPLLQQVARQNPTAVPRVNELKKEVEKGEAADDETVADLITTIAEAVPEAVEGIVNLFTSSVVAKAAGAATRYVLKRIRQ